MPLVIIEVWLTWYSDATQIVISSHCINVKAELKDPVLLLGFAGLSAYV